MLANTDYFLATLWKAKDKNSIFCFGDYQGFGDIDCFSHILVIEGKELLHCMTAKPSHSKRGTAFSFLLIPCRAKLPEN